MLQGPQRPGRRELANIEIDKSQWHIIENIGTISDIEGLR